MFILKRGQIAAEFMLFSGVALIVAIIFVSISLSQTKTLYETRESLLLQDIALKIKNEVSIASNTEDGFSRDFSLPEKINDRDYNISIINNTLVVWTDTSNQIIRILNITGHLNKGSNTITKTNGVIYLN